MGCNCNETQTPCCNDCPESNPCESGCLDIIDASCIEYTSELPTCITIGDGSKLDVVIQAIDDKLCSLSQAGDKFVRISAADSISGYLFDKVTVCNKLTKTIVESGGQQQMHICLSDSAETALTAVDTQSIDFSTSGIAGHTLTGSVKIATTSGNPIFINSTGLDINYTLLVQTIINNPTLLSTLCAAIDTC